MNSILIDVGFDESGRGAVIGPMILTIGITSNLLKLKQEIKILNLKESKQLSLKKINFLSKNIKNLKNFKYIQKIFSAEEITQKQNNGINLNKIEESFIQETLKKLSMKYQINSLKIDEIKGMDIAKIKKYVTGIIENKKNMDKEELLPMICSILSKNEREVQINRNIIGSGYPSDFKTIYFLKRNLQKIQKKEMIDIRYNWKTIKNISKQI